MASNIFRRNGSKWIFSLNSIRNALSSQGIRTLRTESNIVSSKETVANVDGVTLPELLWSNLHKWENDKAFECAVTGKTYTHGEVYRKSKSFSTALLQSGLKRNDVVGIVLPNLPEFPMVYVGIWDAGLIASPTSPNYTQSEIAKQMLSCEAKAVVTVPEMLASVKEAQKSCPDLKSIIVIGDHQEGCHSFFEMIKVSSIGTEFLKGSEITKDDIALLPYSSGTTGPPKGVMLTHKNLATNLLQFSSPDFHNVNVNDGRGTQDRLIGVLPFFHSYAFNVLLAATLYQGHFVSVLPKFNPQLFIKALKNHKPTSMHLVPPLVAFMSQCPDIGVKETKHLRAVLASAAPIGPTLRNNFLEKFGSHIFFQEGYGMTELSPSSHLMRRSLKNSKPSSCGNVVPGAFCKVIDVESGQSLGPEEKGELCVKGPNVMKGYFKNEKATKKTIDSEGWLHTGDIGYYDNDECFYIVDRLKELIKVKGLQVAPAELEDILRKFPGVSDVAVIGIPDERAGEAPRAYIVKAANQSVSETEIHDYVNKQVADHKHLKGGIEFVDAIPKAASGKILRRELKADYLKGHN